MTVDEKQVEISQQKDPASQKRRIVIVDDEERLQQLWKKVLEKDDYEVFTAKGEESLGEVLERIPAPDLVLMDLFLKGSSMDGVELIKNFKNKYGISTNFIVMSGRGDYESLRELIPLREVHDFIEKCHPEETRVDAIRWRVAKTIRKIDAEKRSGTDSTTGIPNRGTLESKLDELVRDWSRHLERAKRNTDYTKLHSWDLSLVMLDIDDFKMFNEKHGHRYGDFVLAEAARELSSQLRTSDFIGRYGGEEFAIIMPCTANGPARNAYDRISWRFSETSRDTMREMVTFSAGIATLTFDIYMNREMLRNLDIGAPDRDKDREQQALGALKEHLVKAADWALGRAKDMKKASGGRRAGHSFPGNGLESYTPDE
jgi:diguanylate cyclase (GGDEF)-like protein